MRETKRKTHTQRDRERQRDARTAGGEWGAKAVALGTLEADGQDLMVTQGGVCFSQAVQQGGRHDAAKCGAAAAGVC